MSELDRLRCQLWAVNIEYSAVVRRKTGEAAYARMAELRAERHVLMVLIAVERQAAAMERALDPTLSSPLRSALHRKVASQPSIGKLAEEDADTVRLLGKSFDEAWDAISGHYGSPGAAEAARQVA
jgi:hypothetical protein